MQKKACLLLIWPMMIFAADSPPLAQIAEPDFSVMEDRMKNENVIDDNPYALAFYRPTYILPYYYTASPYKAIYHGDTPENQPVKENEFKGQLSFKIPVWKNMFHNDQLTLTAAYTQVSYWQFYTHSQYFRETDYEPELFISKPFNHNLFATVGINHQSNGRGGLQERSWNRTFVSTAYSKYNWLLNLKIWTLIFKANSSDKHNPDISDFLGHEELLAAYKWGNNTWSITVRNLERIRQGAFQASWSYEFAPRLNLYLQAFSGYGQSLIEYNHRTNSLGLGVALSDWI